MRNLKKEIEKIKEELVTLRREFHRCPEVGFEEKETAEKIANYLKELGLEVKTGIGKTGVVGVLTGYGPGKTIGIRADIDALPLEEQTGLDFASRNKGRMHACGHDSHIAIGLGAAKILSRYKDQIKGKIKFIFQPGEETLAGARAMLDDGVLAGPAVDAIIGLHNWSDLESGLIGIKKGPIMAAADKFTITIKGKGGHGAVPHQTVDPVVIAANIIDDLQKIVSREIDPLETAVITVGTLNAGTAYNIIPDKAELSGTVRTFNPEVRQFIIKRMEEVTAGYCQGARGEYEFNYNDGIPATVNDPDLTEEVINILKASFGEDKVIESVRPSMGGEDFSLFQQKIPGVYFFLGTRNEVKGITSSIHNPEYLIDEDILPTGVRAFCEVVLNYLL